MEFEGEGRKPSCLRASRAGRKEGGGLRLSVTEVVHVGRRGDRRARSLPLRRRRRWYWL